MEINELVVPLGEDAKGILEEGDDDKETANGRKEAVNSGQVSDAKLGVSELVHRPFNHLRSFRSVLVGVGRRPVRHRVKTRPATSRAHTASRDKRGKIAMERYRRTA